MCREDVSGFTSLVSVIQPVAHMYCINKVYVYLGSTLHPWPEMMRTSAGTLSPPLISTKSPTTKSRALIWFFWPSRITTACCLEERSAKIKKKMEIWIKTNKIKWFLKNSVHLWHQILEAGNDVGALEFLVVTKATSHNNDSNEGDCQVQLEWGKRCKDAKMK